MTDEDGPRMKHLRQALHKMLQATIKNCSGADNTEQCFPFGLTPEQIIQLDALLSSELQAVYGQIQEPFEELLAVYNLPSKLNEIDSFLRAANPPPAEAEAACLNMTPEQRVNAALHQPKKSAVSSLRTKVEHLEWQTRQRREELAARKEALGRRLAHVRDAQRLYEEAVSQLLAVPSGEMERLVDRMVHQAVPNQKFA